MRALNNFYQRLPVPFSVLAPMDGVTDSVFRGIVVKTGKPDVLVTEFTNCDGLCSKGRDVTMERLRFNQTEHPIVAQIWGINPKTFYLSAKLVSQLGFDGIDINMGCPDKKIIKEGACSALIDNHKLAAEIIEATKKGSHGLPVSVKTRIGRNKETINIWIKFLLEQHLSALTVHLRTVQEQSLVPAHWELLPQIVQLRNSIAPNTVLIGNGDVKTVKEGEEKAKKYTIEGIMYGRAIFSDPWLFNEKMTKSSITKKQRLLLFLEHIQEFKKTYETRNNYAILKKYCKIYVSDFDNATDVRMGIMLAKNLEDMETYVSKLLKKET